MSTVVVQGFCKRGSGAIVGGTGDYSGAYGTLTYLAVQGQVSTFLKYCKPVAQRVKRYAQYWGPRGDKEVRRVITTEQVSFGYVKWIKMIMVLCWK